MGRLRRRARRRADVAHGRRGHRAILQRSNYALLEVLEALGNREADRAGHGWIRRSKVGFERLLWSGSAGPSCPTTSWREAGARRHVGPSCRSTAASARLRSRAHGGAAAGLAPHG